MKPPTLQEIYDRTKTHLLTQNQKSIVSIRVGDGNVILRCMYRGPEGRSCAVGCHLKDEYYHPAMETRCANSSIVSMALARSWDCKPESIFGLRLELLDKLQAVHDKKNISDWPHFLSQTAVEFNLIP
jgi:hypothetical protein